MSDASQLIECQPAELLAPSTASESVPATVEPVVPEIHLSPRSLKRTVESHHAAYLRHLGASLLHSYAAGVVLNTAKSRMSRGEWLKFLSANFEDGKSTVSIRTCHRYMRLAKHIAIIAQRRGVEINSTCVSKSAAEQILNGLSLNAALRLTHAAHAIQVDDPENITASGIQDLEDEKQPEPSPNDWLTPPWLNAALLKFWDEINLDPCCENTELSNIHAITRYSSLEDGLSTDLPWNGNVFINPGQEGDLQPWVERAVSEFQCGHIREAILLLPAVTDANWTDLLQPYPRAFLHARLHVAFVSAPELQVPLRHPAMLIFLGSADRLSNFADQFGVFADVFESYSFPNSN